MSGLSSTWGPGGGEGAAPGSRRKKVYEYLKAANELRQAYTSQWSAQANGPNEDYYNTPGAFPDVEIARSGDEEMVLFPSYARRLTGRKKKESHARQRRDSWSQMIDDYRGVSYEGDSPGADGDESEVENAMVDVDVRGWIYAPSREPMTRKHRLMITLARKLSGIPAPTESAHDEAGKFNEKGEDEYVDKQMQTLVDTAEKNADSAWTSSSSGGRTQGTTATSQSASLSKDELSMANSHLMERLRPFLTNPMAGMPVTVFYFNDEQSQSRNMMTDESGHFNLRTALPFVPTHVRVLASEDLSAARPVEIIEPVGVSLISDIDDTVKHSAIANGAKEMFRNTFVRELAELTVDGVGEWYTKLAEQGVELHYVSNAPWQLYPLLERYFKLVGLPPGSFHLKQYTGMLQGIFEPTAERKRGSLEQILRDFPERKFILVGDSGEADLEVYTDIVLANPGRILGVFIRDVTTPDTKPFFQKSFTHHEPTAMRSRSTPQLVEHSDSSNRPALPPRRPREASPAAKDDDSKGFESGDLIDLRDDDEQSPPKSPQTRVPPAKPTKPSSLRSVAAADDPPTDVSTQQRDMIGRKPVPPLPPRRPSAAKTDSLIDLEDTDAVPRSRTEPPAQSGAASSVKNAVASVSSILPSPGDYLPPRPGTADTQNQQSLPRRAKQAPPVPPPRRTNTASSNATTSSSGTTTPRPPPVKQSYPASAAQAALQYATDRLNLSPSPSTGLRQSASNQSLGRAALNSSGTGFSDPGMSQPPLPNRREEMWRRRWERASEILQNQGVVLGSWRVGRDAQPVCEWLVEEAKKEIRR